MVDWLAISKLEIRDRRTWESLGKINPPKEKPYLSELGDEGVHLSWKFITANERLIEPRLYIPKLVTLTHDKMVTDLSYVMIGISSDSFAFNEEMNSFEMKPGVCIEGATYEALRSCAQEFIQCGNICRRLENLYSKRSQLKVDKQLH